MTYIGGIDQLHSAVKNYELQYIIILCDNFLLSIDLIYHTDNTHI